MGNILERSLTPDNNHFLNIVGSAECGTKTAGSNVYPSDVWDKHVAGGRGVAERAYHQTFCGESLDVSEFEKIHRELSVALKEYDENMENPDAAEKLYSALIEMRKNKAFWNQDFSNHGKKFSGIHLPIYAKIISGFQRIATHTGNIFSLFQGGNHSVIEKLIEYHSGMASMELRKGEQKDYNLLLTYREFLPSMLFNYALACLYAERLDDAMKYTGLSIQFSQILGSRLDVIRAMLLAAEILRVGGGTDSINQSKQILNKLKSTIEEFSTTDNKAKKDIVSQFLILKALVDPSPANLALITQAQAGDSEDRMRYYLAIFSSQCKQGQLDSWDQEVEKYFQGNGGYILFPALVTFLSQSQRSGFSLPREKKYITWMYNFIYKNNEFLETSGISWYETLKSLIITETEGANNENWLTYVEEIMQDHVTSFHECYKRNLPITFRYKGNWYHCDKTGIVMDCKTQNEEGVQGIDYDNTTFSYIGNISDIGKDEQGMKLFVSSLYERAFQTSLKSLFHSLELESKELYSAIQSLAASAHEDLQETNRLMESLQGIFSQIMRDPKLLETQGVAILKLISDTKERIKAAQYVVYGIQSGAVTLLDQIGKELEEYLNKYMSHGLS